MLTAGFEWVLNPPAGWIQAALLRVSDQRLDLQALQGGLFDGDASLHWRPPIGSVQSLGRWGWHFGWLDGTASGPGWTVRSLAGPVHGGVEVQPGLRTWTLHDLQLSLPAEAVPAGLAAWDLLHAKGQLELASEALQITAGKVTGRGSLRWQHASIALTPLAPLGSWQATWDAKGDGGLFELATLSGPLHLDGSGRFSLDGRLGVHARAWAEPASGGDLTPLLGALGTVREDGSVAFELPWPQR